MFDTKLLLKDSGAVTSSRYGTVNASAKVINLGSGLVRGNVIIDISAIKISDSDEKYSLHLMGGSDESFTLEVSLCSKELGHNASLEGNRDSKISRVILPFQNAERGFVYPFLRIRHVISGTSPSINYQTRFQKNLPILGATAIGVTSTTTTTTTTTTT